MITHSSDGFMLCVDRGPNWLFVQLRPRRNFDQAVSQLADELWRIASRHFIYRLVLELEELPDMPPEMTTQLVLLQERLAQRGGALRICGLSHSCAGVLLDHQLDTALPNYTTREAAVLGEEITAFRDRVKKTIASAEETDKCPLATTAYTA